MFTILRNNVIYYNQKAEGVEKADAMEAFMDDPTVDLRQTYFGGVPMIAGSGSVWTAAFFYK